MGNYLRDALGDSYQIVGFSFSNGSFNALRKCQLLEPPQVDSVNFFLHYADYDRFIFVLEDMGRDSILKEWFSGPGKFLNIGALPDQYAKNYYRDETVTKFYDVLIHFDTVNEAGRL